MAPGIQKHGRTLLVVCLLWTAAVGALHLTEQRYNRAEQTARDWLATNGAARRSPQNPRVVFLALDDASKDLDALFAEDLEKSRALQLMKQGWPWNREVYALIIDRLVEAGASVVIFDMIFPAPRFGDKMFREALDRHSGRVVLGTNLKDIAEDANASQSTVTHKPAHILPTPVLRPPGPENSWLGFVNVREDEDRIVRRIQYRTTLLEFFGKPPEQDGEILFSLSARALEKADLAVRIPASHEPVLFRFCEEFLPRSLHEIFVDAHWDTPYYDRGNFFRGKIVLIGAAGNEAEDRLRTPLGTVLAPIIHLSAINAALNSDFLTETSLAANLALIAGAGGFAWALGAFVRRPVARLLLLGFALLAYYGAAQMLFNERGLVLILLSPMLVFSASGISWSAWEQVIDRMERQRIRRTLERYVGRDVAHEVLDNPTSYLNSLGGVRKDITVLFSDVRGFTTLTEVADEQALVKQLNEYFEEMVSIVFANQGTLDKFIGDAVMAHWGSIVSEGAATDAHRAVTTVLQMRQALTRLNAAWRQRGIHEMHVGFGVNHGKAIVGNLGCEAKMEVSVIGDAVNVGSRLEGVTKQYKIDICIGEQVAALVRESFILRSVDLIVVAGKTRPVEIFAVLDKRAPGVTEPPWLARHEDAVRLYRLGDFFAAETAWREVREQAPDDAITGIFLARCERLQEHEPEGEWKGVFEMASK